MDARNETGEHRTDAQGHRRRLALWFAAFAYGVCMPGTTLPTPLYPLYQLAGLLAQYAPLRLRLPFFCELALLAPGFFGIWFAPEKVQRKIFSMAEKLSSTSNGIEHATSLRDVQPLAATMVDHKHGGMP